MWSQTIQWDSNPSTQVDQQEEDMTMMQEGVSENGFLLSLKICARSITNPPVKTMKSPFLKSLLSLRKLLHYSLLYFYSSTKENGLHPFLQGSCGMLRKKMSL